MQKLTTFLMFVGPQHGKAEEAMSFYVSLFKNSRIMNIERYAAGEEEPEGTVKHATFSLAGQEFMAIDSHRPHDFTFTPSMSIFVQCDTEGEIDALYQGLVEGGGAMMPLGDYGFSRKFGWLADKYGVSWQVNLAK